MFALRFRAVAAAIFLAVAHPSLHAQHIDPDVRAEPPLVDFGDLRPGDSAARTVEIYNLTAHPIHIREARPNCNCSVVSIESKVIPPGKSVPISLGFNAQEKLGQIEPYVVVTFQERLRPLRIPTRAHVNHGIRFKAVQIQPGLDYPIGIDLTAIDDEPFRIVAVDGRPPSEVLRSRNENDGPRTNHVFILDRAIDTDGKRTDPALRDHIVIETDHPTAPIVLIDTNAKPFPRVPDEPGPWTIDRTRILGWVHPGEERQLEALLQTATGEPLSAIQRIRVRSSTADAGLLGIAPAPNGLVIRLFLDVHESTPPNTLVEAAIEITIGDHTRTLTLLARTPSAQALMPPSIDQGAQP